MSTEPKRGRGRPPGTKGGGRPPSGRTERMNVLLLPGTVAAYKAWGEARGLSLVEAIEKRKPRV